MTYVKILAQVLLGRDSGVVYLRKYILADLTSKKIQSCGSCRKDFGFAIFRKDFDCA